MNSNSHNRDNRLPNNTIHNNKYKSNKRKQYIRGDIPDTLYEINNHKSKKYSNNNNNNNSSSSFLAALEAQRAQQEQQQQQQNYEVVPIIHSNTNNNLISSTTSSSSTSTSNTKILSSTLPGYYYDPIKNRHFKIPLNASSPLKHKLVTTSSSSNPHPSHSSSLSNSESLSSIVKNYENTPYSNNNNNHIAFIRNYEQSLHNPSDILSTFYSIGKPQYYSSMLFSYYAQSCLPSPSNGFLSNKYIFTGTFSIPSIYQFSNMNNNISDRPPRVTESLYNNHTYESFTNIMKHSLFIAQEQKYYFQNHNDTTLYYFNNPTYIVDSSIDSSKHTTIQWLPSMYFNDTDPSNNTLFYCTTLGNNYSPGSITILKFENIQKNNNQLTIEPKRIGKAILPKGSLWCASWLNNQRIFCGTSTETAPCIYSIHNNNNNNNSTKHITKEFTCYFKRKASDVFASSPLLIDSIPSSVSLSSNTVSNSNTDLSSSSSSSSSSIVLFGCRNGEIHLWDTREKYSNIIYQHKNSIVAIHNLYSSGLVLTANSDTDMILHDPRMWSKPFTTKFPSYQNKYMRNDVTVNPQGTIIAAGCKDNYVRLWNIDGKLLKEYSTAFPPSNNPTILPRYIQANEEGFYVFGNVVPKCSSETSNNDHSEEEDIITKEDHGNLMYIPIM